MPAKPQPFDPAAIRARLARGLAAMATVLPGDSDSLIDPLVAYLAELNKWNAAYNLTAVRNPADMVVRHILDSLTVLPYLRGKRILDAGTGAGLPGIPLALSCPDRQFTLLDSNGKKVRFVNPRYKLPTVPHLPPEPHANQP